VGLPEVREETNTMQQITSERCNRLRKLHSSLTEELRALKETREEMELESFENPIETVSVIKSLQGTLNTIDQELAKCPAENA
jgi:Zn-finger domain-containing protein